MAMIHAPDSPPPDPSLALNHKAFELKESLAPFYDAKERTPNVRN